MDYFLSSQDVLSLQEMFESDYKLDIDFSAQESQTLDEMFECNYKTDIDNVLVGTDISLSLHGDLPSLDLDDTLSNSNDFSLRLSTGNSQNGNCDSSSTFNLDFLDEDPSLLVAPNSSIPVTATSKITNSSINSSSSLVLNNSAFSRSSTTMSSSGPTVSFSRSPAATVSRTIASPQRQTFPRQHSVSTIRIASATSTSHANNAVSSSNCGLPVLLTNSKTVPVVTSSTKSKQISHLQVSQRNVHYQVQTKKQLTMNNNKHFSDYDYDEKSYPKPAYSYSCLIAMALKNSKTGSLPVSEIYNFMCEHFPYFKTAPNGWKNSVRHNLSLNKCFEKIEKPSGNGSQQRKGCLWAMNPAKIAKMDEEVQKWSKKDPMAIKNAMVYPENLEMLERGEMKREYIGSSDATACASSSGGEESEAEDVEQIMSSPEAQSPSPSPGNDPEFIDINNFVVPSDSFDESSLTDFDIEVAEGIYDDFDAEEDEDDDDDEKVNLGIRLTSTTPIDIITSSISSTITLPVVTSTIPLDSRVVYSSPSKKSRVSTSTIQGNYVYKPVVSVSSTSIGTTRRKIPLLLRASPAAASLIKLEDQ